MTTTQTIKRRLLAAHRRALRKAVEAHTWATAAEHMIAVAAVSLLADYTSMTATRVEMNRIARLCGYADYDAIHEMWG